MEIRPDRNPVRITSGPNLDPQQLLLQDETMNISSLPSPTASLFAQDFRAKAKGIVASGNFRSHKPMPSQIADGKDHGSPAPAIQVSRFKGPLPAQSILPTTGRFNSNDPGPIQNASTVAPGIPVTENSLPNMGLFNSNDPLPSMGLFNSNDPGPNMGLFNSNDPVGGHGRGPMPRQFVGFASVAASASNVGAAVPQMDFSA